MSTRASGPPWTFLRVVFLLLSGRNAQEGPQLYIPDPLAPWTPAPQRCSEAAEATALGGSRGPPRARGAPRPPPRRLITQEEVTHEPSKQSNTHRACEARTRCSAPPPSRQPARSSSDAAGRPAYAGGRGEGGGGRRVHRVSAPAWPRSSVAAPPMVRPHPPSAHEGAHTRLASPFLCPRVVRSVVRAIAERTEGRRSVQGGRLTTILPARVHRVGRASWPCLCGVFVKSTPHKKSHDETRLGDDLHYLRGVHPPA